MIDANWKQYLLMAALCALLGAGALGYPVGTCLARSECKRILGEPVKCL